MFYISSQPRAGIFGITDTSDGVEEFYSEKVIRTTLSELKIKGVTPKGIKVVDASKAVAKKSFDKFKDIVKKKIYSYDFETCCNLARSGGFVRQLKGLDNTPDEYHKIVFEHVYTKSVDEVTKSASNYTNTLMEVNCANVEDIKNALRNNVCLVLQHSTKGNLTAFICTGSLDMVDKLFGVGTFDKAYLTKSLTDMVYDVSKVRKYTDESTRKKNPDLLPVFSCSLRFRESLLKSCNLKELSSPMYSVNLGRVLGIFILNNPYELGNFFTNELQKIRRDVTKYKFDMRIYDMVSRCLEDGTCYLGNEAELQKLAVGQFKEGVSLEDIAKRFTSNFDYMEYLRLSGYSFK